MEITGWVIYNGFLQGNKFRDFAEMLRDAATARGHQIRLLKNSEIVNKLDHSGFSISMSEKPDYVLFTDKDIYLATTLEQLGIQVFNRSRAIEISDDKIKTHQVLATEQIPMPKTIVAPTSYGFSIENDELFLRSVISELGFPMIIKEAFGSFGEQVYLIHDEAELRTCLQKVRHVPFIFQQFIHSSYGVDLRLQVVGERVVTAMKRSSKSDFRANVTSGGTMERYEPTADEMDLAVRATKAIGAHFAGVDLLLGQNEQRFVCEVNSNAHIRNLYDCTGINAANHIVTYIETFI